MKPLSGDDQELQTTWDDDGTVDVLPGSAARPTAAEPLQSVMQKAISRRTLLKGTGVASATLVVAPGSFFASKDAFARTAAADPAHRLTFQTVPPGNEPDVVVPPNYTVDVLLRWGDPLMPSAPAFDVDSQTGEAQAQQFGFNADLVLWFPLPGYVKQDVQQNSSLGAMTSANLGAQYPVLKDLHSPLALMLVNHEYTSGDDMFPLYEDGNPTQDEVETEIEAHGFSVVELALGANQAWNFDINSPFNRRVTGSTPMDIAGPLRGHPMMQTSADPAGTTVLGCLNNCAGGKTPWGTVLTCEENFDQYFANFASVPADVRAVSERVPAEDAETDRRWENFVSRFDLAQEPNEYNRFGFIVEVDPYDPTATPKKRTSLGRFKHEGAAVRVTADDRVAVYSGDDARFEYVYKFISAAKFRRYGRAANMDLLDNGILYVARFDAGGVEGDEMGSGVWLPLVWAPGNALDQAGFTSQAEVLLNTRGAADVMGATPMDRPEDIEISPTTGKVYVALTNNSRRTEPNEANPRVDNQHGHVIEIIETDNDAGAKTFSWNILIKCGDPNVAEHDTSFGPLEDPVSLGVSPISDPDNLVHDCDGNLWIATDGQFFSDGVGFGQNDGVFAVPVEGVGRGWLRQFLSGVPGGEVCGPEFSGDNHSLFCAIQHPHDGQAFENLWPTDETDVSKPSLIAVRENSGLKIGR